MSSSDMFEKLSLVELVRGAPFIRAAVFETVQAAVRDHNNPASHVDACLTLLGIWAGVVSPMDIPEAGLARSVIETRLAELEKRVGYSFLPVGSVS